MTTEGSRIFAHPVLGPLPAGEWVEFTWNGRVVTGVAGEPIAAALWANGIVVLGENAVTGAPRGLYCAIGHCYECRVVVDGVRGVRACLEPVRAGMRVQAMLREGAVSDGRHG